MNAILEILLMLQAAINRQEHIELTGHKPQEFAVFLPCPTHLRDSANPVPRKFVL